jgi:uncharacterized protein
MTAFETTPRNRVLRKAKRGSYERDEIHAIVDAALVCHVGYVIDGQPYVMPTLLARDGDTLFIHGSSTSRTILHAGAGNPICITVTLTDALVLARSVFNHSINYRSAVLFGQGRLIDDPDAKMAALYRFSERMVPGRWDDVRPMNPQEFKATGIVAVPIDAASAKIRNGDPIDEPEDVDLPIWGGLVPVLERFGAPIPDEFTPPGMPVPGYLRELIERRNG